MEATTDSSGQHPSRRPVVELINDSGYPFLTSKPGDVGHDLFASILNNDQNWLERFLSEIVGWPLIVLWPFQTKNIHTGVRVSQPNSVWCEIVARSSTTKRHLMVFNGIIDSGYQGELFVVLRNLSLKPKIVKQGERYAQAIFHGAVRPGFWQVQGFTRSSARGSTGFGSTGQ